MGALIDITAAQSKDQIPRLGLLDDIIGDFFKGLKPDASRYFVRQVFGINTIDIGFPDGKDFGNHSVIRNGKRFSKIVQQQEGPGEGVGLENSPDLLEPQIGRASCRERVFPLV